MPEFDQELDNVQIPENTGVRELEIQLGDSVAEGESIIEYEVQVADGNWDPYCSPDNGDYQVGVYGDWSTCTNYGCGHSLEAQERRLFKLGMLTIDEIARLESAGFIENGDVTRLSKRHNAIHSGTNGGQIPGQFLGNYQKNPWATARNIGMVPEKLCPFPRLQRTPPFLVHDYFDSEAVKTSAVKAAEAVWLSIFEVRYEFVPTDDVFLAKHVKQAPLTINTAVCSGWGTGDVPACSSTNGHITTLMNILPNGKMSIEDSYKPSRKLLAADYNVSSVIKGVLYLKRLLDAPTPPVFVPAPPVFTFTAMKFGDQGSHVVRLQDFLKVKGFFPINTKSTGYYGQITANAVLKYQLANKLASPALLKSWRGYFVGPLTLPLLNKR